MAKDIMAQGGRPCKDPAVPATYRPHAVGRKGVRL
jgi:hypothetical protein